jgi:N-acyl-D-amino-acid deacylase
VLDLLLAGGRVVDGTGNPWIRADVGISGGRIASVSRLGGAVATRTIDVSGLMVSPGFIDMHTHSDLQILVDPAHEPKVHQGVTLDVLGQDGLSYAPVDDTTLTMLRVQLRGWNDDPAGFDWSWRSVGEYLDRIDQGVAVNAAYLVPHGTVRMLVVGMEDRPPSEAELDRMKQLVADGMEQGAVGMSAGLTYAPAMYADDEELVSLCEVVAAYGGYYQPHHRNYGTRALEEYAACIEISRRSGAPVQLTHALLPFEINEGRAPELLAMVDRARAEGVDVTLDTYPYLAGCTYLHALLPGWMQAGGPRETLARLADRSLRERLRLEMEEEGSDGFQGVPLGWQMVAVAAVVRPQNERWVGKNLMEAAEEARKRPIDFYCDLLVDEELGSLCLEFVGSEANLQAIMAHPAHMVGSDGLLAGSRPHPRAWGTFPRYLARYVRELGILTLEQAIRKMTSLPAQRLGFPDRGLLRPGMAADIVCFDPETVRDTATYEDPKRLPDGIPYVIVNGTVVVEDGKHTGELPGRALRKPPVRRRGLPGSTRAAPDA